MPEERRNNRGCPKCGKELLVKDGNDKIECLICSHTWNGRRAEDEKILTYQEERREWC
jgi:uncharacterized Zn finger protein (UPF0148 family)